MMMISENLRHRENLQEETSNGTTIKVMKLKNPPRVEVAKVVTISSIDNQIAQLMESPFGSNFDPSGSIGEKYRELEEIRERRKKVAARRLELSQDWANREYLAKQRETHIEYLSEVTSLMGP